MQNWTFETGLTEHRRWRLLKRWRSLASSPSFQEDCVAIAVDEAHCLVHWWVYV